MTNQAVASTIYEQSFLKRNSMLSFIVGLFFSIEPIYRITSPVLEQHLWLKNFILLTGIGLFIAVVVVFVKTLPSIKRANKKAFWFGEFSDEYLNYVNKKGYKYSFFSTVYFLIFYKYIDKHLMHFFNNLPADDLATLAIAVALIGYGLPVITELRGEDG